MGFIHIFRCPVEQIRSPIQASAPQFALAIESGLWQKKSVQAETVVVTKPNVLKSQLPLIIVAVTLLLLTIVWLVSRTIGHSKCDSIFEQTADRLRGNLEFIKIKGELALGREKVQELAEASQKVALHLKSCCIAQQAGVLNAEQFQVCMSGAKDYQTQIIQVATNIKEADVAAKQQKPELAKQKTDAAKAAASEVPRTEKTLAKATQTLAGSVSVKGGAEQEPNNTIPQANVADMGTTIAGEINPADDVDFFKFQYHDAKKRRDIVIVHLENRSTTLRPQLILYNEDKSLARDWTAANASGANLEFSFPAKSGKTYYVGVGSYYNGSTGAYTLAVVPQKAYDQYEPNDDAFTATPLKVGQTVEANIMDGVDVDSYRVSGVKGKTLTIQLENSSPALRPSIRVLKSDKSVLRDWNAANAPGADLTLSIPSDPGQDYFVEVGSYYNESAGPYKLTVR
jgi:hypothetical protein